MISELDSPTYLNPDAALDERVEDLLSRMTVEEKAGQLLYTAPAIPRLKVAAYNWWNECLHGVARAGRATVFPQAIGMAATFDPALLKEIAEAIALEGRAKYHRTLNKNGETGQYQGLTFWTPNINIFRDPRWGRGQETYGEDPFLTATLGSAFVKGLQGDDPKYLKAAGCAKHYAVHSGPEKLRHEFNAIADPYDLWDTYLPAFQALVEAGVESFMGAYNRTNGEVCCASPTLMGDILRSRWNFKGHYVSDCWALRDFHTHHKITADSAESAALAIKEGCDLNCGCVYESLLEALDRKLVTEEQINVCLRRLLRTRFRLGMFDPQEKVPLSDTPEHVVNCPEHRKLARETATRGMVLLRNNNNILPLRKDFKRVYVTGPNASNVDVLLGNYYGSSGQMNTFLEAVSSRVDTGTVVEYRTGFQWDRENINPADWTTFEAAKSDVTLVFLGLHPLFEGEEGDAIASATSGDRPDLSLDPAQLNFLRKLKDRGAKVVAIFSGGSPIVMPEIEELTEAIIWSWYPGEEGGNALADILFGDAVPSGRLPITFPRLAEDLPPFEDYGMKGRTYRYSEVEPLFPFGFGLSYTQFAYRNLEVLDQGNPGNGEKVKLKLSLANTGNHDAQEVVQTYISHLCEDRRKPLMAMKDFRRVFLKAGEAIEVELELSADAFALVNEKGEKEVPEGKVKVTVGGAAPIARSLTLGAAEPVSIILDI